MSHKVKSNGSVKELAELQELEIVEAMAQAVYPAGLGAVDVKFNASAAQDGSFVDFLFWVNGRNPLPGTGVYVLSLMGPKASNKMIFGYRNGSGVYGQIWAI